MSIVIDDDLGRSGGGTARPGFERLLAAICTGAAGAVLAIEASRLARNGRDWHTLLEFCTLVSSLIIDEDGVYDPKLINDRLLLGMKGTFSELELSILRQRSQEALRLKAARGDLHTSVAIGYVRSADDRLEIDPDKRVREALHLAFRKFAEFGSVRQVSMWLCDEGLKMPIVVYGPARSDGGVAVAPLQYDPSAVDQSDLCWRLRVWPDRIKGSCGSWSQTDHAQCSPGTTGMGGTDP